MCPYSANIHSVPRMTQNLGWVPRIFRWAKCDAWLQGALFWWGWLGAKKYNLRELIFKRTILYLKPWKRPGVHFLPKQGKKMTLGKLQEYQLYLALLATYQVCMACFLVSTRLPVLFQHLSLPHRALWLRGKLILPIAPEVYSDLCKPVMAS